MSPVTFRTVPVPETVNDPLITAFPLKGKAEPVDPPVPAEKTSVFVAADVMVTFIPLKLRLLVGDAENCVTPLTLTELNEGKF